jgi:hypothetical protein
MTPAKKEKNFEIKFFTKFIAIGHDLKGTQDREFF